MSKYEIDVWEYADEFKNLDTNETFYGYQVCELLEHKDQQISDLETKLAEAQKTIEIQKMSNNALQEENLDYRYDITDTAYEQAKYMTESWEEDYQQENQQLKQQLHDLPKKIVEEIRKWGQKHYNWVGDGTGYDGQDYNECIGFNMAIDQLNEILDTILKKYGVENE